MFTLKSKYSPAWDQPEAIKSVSSFIDAGHQWQTLWWITWSGKTFTMANLIEKYQKPTLIIAHNKTLAAQLAQEFKEFFPDNAVHYFVSYYDYYQPEAYVSKTDTYIEKEATINEEIDRLRHAATQDLLQRKDVIIVASVSCIYGIGDIKSYTEAVFKIKKWDSYQMEELLKSLVDVQYKRAWADFKPGTFQVMWDVLEVFSASQETVYTIEFWWEEATQITRRNYLTWEVYEYLDQVTIFPAKHTVTTKDEIKKIIPLIEEELKERLAFFEATGEVVKHERLKTKVEYDMEMMQEVGYVNGIENYSRYLDGRKPWEPWYTLIDYFGDDYLCFIDESHMTIPQIWAMYAWDRSRKENLVSNWFRLPCALDNRPLKFEEFEQKMNQVVAVSATPGKYEVGTSSKDPQNFFSFDPTKWDKWNVSQESRIVPQLIRPTGLLDPKIILKPMEFMVDDIMNNLATVIEKWERMLITTLTKRSSEELTDYLLENGIKVQYLHSEVDTLDRLEILKNLRLGEIDVIVWVNLLREWLDLPEVSKIAILDADKQGFLRSEPALVQIIGRAARNDTGEVTMYSEKLKVEKKGWEETLTIEMWEDGRLNLWRLDNGKWITPEWLVISEAMRKAIGLTYYRRWIQKAHNEKIGMTPKTVFSSIKDVTVNKRRDYSNIKKKNIKTELARLELEMDIAAANMEYEKAAELRDAILEIKGKKKRRG